MSLFHSYVMRDVVEVEPVYLPDGEVKRQRNTTGEGSPDAQAYQCTVDDILMHRLTERYVGRIVPSLGLCVAIHEVAHYTSGIVRGSSASAWFTVQFRVCVFSPTPGARVRATIGAQTREGIFLSLDFFQFVFFVPGDQLIAPSFFDEGNQCWMLRVDDGTDEDAVNPYEKGDEVVVRVDRVIVRDPVDLHRAEGARGSTSNAMGNADGTRSATGGLKDSGREPQVEKWPMEVYGSFVGTGLGPVVWF
ncbi:RNA polymerase subunit, putative [Trypanosoma brucei gambiense DAL972]|uniref:RNA polymerase subunit, putative n=2 Tax=Trypanosoma brucei TaxID=5691 RepID=D0A9K8_TRYB9|nr:RNA polymerase subunit, putative [Trypanosoma brucei gambiense DAL972]RHW67800.1 RNA polymerase subunit [Trypanosoma brucei equiperdum]CBH18359.1 RNA polymerase subunit, putative [Trypanosoma brucei gambiense DAL972]|eukprot:XP_011780623.1 RNA polymerase subunit, putative [Trypanosoma brucei gambiense DAL972]